MSASTQKAEGQGVRLYRYLDTDIDRPGCLEIPSRKEVRPGRSKRKRGKHPEYLPLAKIPLETPRDTDVTETEH